MEDYNSTSLNPNCSFFNISDNTLIMDCVQPPPEQYPVPLGKKLWAGSCTNTKVNCRLKVNWKYFLQFFLQFTSLVVNHVL